MALHESVAMAVATSGSAIVFAGTTVVIALLALLVAGIPLVTALGYSSAVAVVTAVLAAITLLPAVLSLVGPHIESVRVPAFLRPSPKDLEGGFWGGWARALTTRPWWAIVGALALLIPLIIPFLSLNLGQEDIGATPKSTTERQAYDLMAAGLRRRLQRPTARRGQARNSRRSRAASTRASSSRPRACRNSSSRSRSRGRASSSS